jgi:CubicO group peptidase (beta-lactamase class C family)
MWIFSTQHLKGTILKLLIKSRIYSFFTFFIAIFFATACTAEPPYRFASEEQLIKSNNVGEQIDQVLVSQHMSGAFDGTVLIRKKDELIYRRVFGYSNREQNKKNSVDTISDIGSIAKSYTATAILLLADRDELSLQDTLKKFYPDIPADKKDITLHQLLTHTSGLINFHSRNDFEQLSRQNAENIIFKKTLRAQPGREYHYSNAGYTLLASIIERVSKQSFESYVKKELLTPLNLVHTGWYQIQELNQHDIAFGYVNRDKGVRTFDKPFTWALKGGGGMVSSIEDMSAWLDALIAGTLFSDQMKKEIFQQPALGRALGGWHWIEINNTPAIEIGGSTDYGYTAKLQYYPESQISVILLFNGYSDKYGSRTHHIISNEILSSILINTN